MNVRHFRNNKVLTFHNRFFSDDTRLMMSSEVDEKTLESTWNVPELKKEAGRLTLKCHKKIGQASTRLSKANETVEELRTKPDVTQKELEACPDIKTLETDLAEWKERLAKLNQLEEKLQSVKGKSAVLPEDIASIALGLGVNDAPPIRPARQPKQKGPRVEAPRMPYFRYYSKNKTEIRVSEMCIVYIVWRYFASVCLMSTYITNNSL